MQQVFIWHGDHLASFSMLASQALGLSVSGLAYYNHRISCFAYLL